MAEYKWYSFKGIKKHKGTYVNEMSDVTKENSDKIYKLNEFIRVNDIQNKAETIKKKMRHFYEDKKEFERKENLDIINTFKLEEE